MSDTRNRTLAAAGAGLGCLTILVGAGAIAAGIGAWVWWTPRADSIRFEGAGAPPVTTHEPVRLRDATVLDQHGVTRADELFRPHGQQRHPVFVPLRLPRHADDHETTGFDTDVSLKLSGMGSG